MSWGVFFWASLPFSGTARTPTAKTGKTPQIAFCSVWWKRHFSHFMWSSACSADRHGVRLQPMPTPIKAGKRRATRRRTYPAAKEVPFFPYLSVTSDGVVIITTTRKRLSISLNQSGYARVSVRIAKKRRQFLVHRLIASAWCPGYHPALQVNHINSNRSDNRPENLEWVTQEQNNAHKMVTWSSNPSGLYGNAKLRDADVIEIRKQLHAGVRVSRLAWRFGVAVSRVSMIKTGKTWKHLLTEDLGPIPAKQKISPR